MKIVQSSHVPSLVGCACCIPLPKLWHPSAVSHLQSRHPSPRPPCIALPRNSSHGSSPSCWRKTTASSCSAKRKRHCQPKVFCIWCGWLFEPPGRGKTQNWNQTGEERLNYWTWHVWLGEEIMEGGTERILFNIFLYFCGFDWKLTAWSRLVVCTRVYRTTFLFFVVVLCTPAFSHEH